MTIRADAVEGERIVDLRMERQSERSVSLEKEPEMYCRLITKRQRDKRGAKQKQQDVQAWLLIGAIFIGTMLAVWLPLLFSALHS